MAALDFLFAPVFQSKSYKVPFHAWKSGYGLSVVQCKKKTEIIITKEGSFEGYTFLWILTEIDRLFPWILSYFIKLFVWKISNL